MIPREVTLVQAIPSYTSESITITSKTFQKQNHLQQETFPI